MSEIRDRNSRGRRLMGRGALPAVLMVAASLILPGCGGGTKTAEKTEEWRPQLKPPKIAVKPKADVLDEAVRKHGGDVSRALDSLVPEVDRKSLIVRNAAGRIEAVDLSGMSLSAAGLKHLAALKDSLQRVNLDRVYVTDDALQVIASLPGLKKLELNQTPITNAGLAHLANAKQLSELSLKGTKINDEGLKHLVTLDRLRLLSLTFTGVTDAGVEQLAKLKNLHTLILDDTAVSDAGLAHLAGLKKLSFVHVTGTQVTDAGVERLRKSLPGVDVRGP